MHELRLELSFYMSELSFMSSDMSELSLMPELMNFCKAGHAFLAKRDIPLLV